MGVLADVERILAVKDQFYHAAETGNLESLKSVIFEHTRDGVLDPHLYAPSAVWHAIRGNTPNTCEVLDFLWPHFSQSEVDDEQWDSWLRLAVQQNQRDVVAYLLPKYPTKNFSEIITLATQLKKPETLSLLLANTTAFDAIRGIDEFTSIGADEEMAQIWLPYLSQEHIDHALVLSATKKTPEVVKALAPLCSAEVCEQAILEAFFSELNCLDCVAMLRPFVGTLSLYGVYSDLSSWEKRRYTKETLALLPMIDVNRWNGLAPQEAHTGDVVKLFYPHCNPYQIQGLLRIKHYAHYPYNWTDAIAEDERTADTERLEQLRQMKTDAQPILDFVQAVKDGNSSYIASAAVDDDTVNGAFVMSMKWNNDSPKHLLARGICNETMWGALMEAIEHKSPHLLWLIDQYEYAQCPKRKIYAKIVANKLLNKRLFGVYTQMTPMFSHLNTTQLALRRAYSKSAKAVQTVLQNTPPPLEILQYLFDNGHYRWMAHVVSEHPQVNYLPTLQKVVVGGGPWGSQATQHKREKILNLLCSQHLKQHPEDLEKILDFSIEKNCASIVSFLLPQADEVLRAQLFVTAASTTCFFDNLFSTQYSTEIYTKAMLQGVFYGRNICIDKLWEYADVEKVHTQVREGGYTNQYMLYFYQRLDEQHTREHQRHLLIEAVGHTTRTDLPEVGRRI